ncbi:hypothetical protein IW141_002170 [Coemansia sp. RSA 355]|nr:hypothetical protein IW141_002170 [Coemansia sp. RSA 355]
MKSEPESRIIKGIDVKFSIDDLQAMPDATSQWDGVRNYKARNYLRDDIKRGDKVLFYHSNCKVPGIAGLAIVTKEGYPDYTAFDAKHPYYDPKSSTDAPKWFMVDVKFERKFDRILPLAEIKQHNLLKEMALEKAKTMKEVNTKVVYRKYASLYFVAGIGLDDNELLTLEIIHRYVEVLDRFFGNVCELDLIFQFQKAYYILDEMIMAGELQEASKKTVLRVIAQQDETEAVENSERGWGDLNLEGVARTAMLTVQEFKQSFSK